MTNYIPECQAAAGITKLQVTTATSEMPSPRPAGNDLQSLSSIGLTWEAVMSTGIRARMVTIRMLMWKKIHHKLFMDHRIMWTTDSIVGLAWEPVRSMGMMARLATMLMKWMKHCKQTRDQRRMWRTEGIVLESGKIAQ
jgi:hypothetical protein